MEHTIGRTICLVLDKLHPWNISQIVLGRGHQGNATQLGPLHGPGMSEGGSGKGAHRLPT